MIELARAQDGRLVVGSSQPFPAEVKRVEYYKGQRYFMLVYDNENEDSDLMPCELAENIGEIVEKSPDVIIIAMAEQGQEPYGYQVPLIQIGV